MFPFLYKAENILARDSFQKLTLSVLLEKDLKVPLCFSQWQEKGKKWIKSENGSA